MKLLLSTFLTFFLVSSPLMVSKAVADENPSDRYLDALQSLPNNSTSYNRVFRLVKRLVKLKPEKTYTYYITGEPKLNPYVSGRRGGKLGRATIRLLYKTDLPRSRQTKIARRISIYFQGHPTLIIN